MYHLGDKSFSFGNIYENTLDETWDGAKRRQVVEMCRNHLDLSTCQVCCKGHEINKLIHFMETPDPHADVNFL
jgi:GTP 3',8-cyclase